MARNLIVAFFVVLLTAGDIQAQGAPRLGESDAIRIAAEFCKNAGVPVDAPARAVFPAPTNYHWQPAWEVTLRGQAVVNVLDANRTVSSYVNRAAINRLGDD